MLSLVFLATLLIVPTPPGPAVELWLDEAQMVVVAEAVATHDVDGTPVEEVALVRSLKGSPAADRIFYVPPHSCDRRVLDPAEKGDRILLLLRAGEGEVHQRSFWKALDAITAPDSFVALASYFPSRFRADREGRLTLPAEGEAEDAPARTLADLIARVEAKLDGSRQPLR
jgi:hypothetical protein